MSQRLMFWCLAAAIAAGSPSFAGQLGPADDTRVDTRHLTLTMSSSTAAVAAGERVTLYVDVVPKPKMHVYAPDQTDYIPIELKIEAGPAYRAEAIKYPPAETFFFAPLNETQRVYSKPFRITQPVTVAKNTAAISPLIVKGTVRYQACDDAICYLPQTITVTWKVPVKNGARSR